MPGIPLEFFPEVARVARDGGLSYQMLYQLCHVIIVDRLAAGTLLPLDRGGWLAGDVVHHAVDAIYLVHHSITDFRQHIVGEA